MTYRSSIELDEETEIKWRESGTKLANLVRCGLKFLALEAQWSYLVKEHAKLQAQHESLKEDNDKLRRRFTALLEKGGV